MLVPGTIEILRTIQLSNRMNISAYACIQKSFMKVLQDYISTLFTYLEPLHIDVELNIYWTGESSIFRLKTDMDTVISLILNTLGWVWEPITIVN